MDEIRPPSTRVDEQPIRIEKPLKFKKDAGTSWARALHPTQVADLVDLAGELAVIFPVVKQRRVTESQFKKKLHELGAAEAAEQKLKRLVGNTAGLVTPYDIWWAYAWVYNLTAARADRDEGGMRENTARRMGMTLAKVEEKLARRDISYLVNLFLSRRSRELEGEIRFRVAQEALDGGARAMEMYFRHVAGKDNQEEGERGGMLDPFAMTEGELQAEVARMKKQVGTKKDDWQLPEPKESDE